MKPRHSFRRILSAATLAPLVLTLTLAPPASAGTVYWANQTTGNFQWTDINQWRIAGQAPGSVPVNGDPIILDSAYMRATCGIDVAGADLNLPASTLSKTYNGRNYTIYDSTTLTANNNPLANYTDFTPVAPSTTLVEAANASSQVLRVSQMTSVNSGIVYWGHPFTRN